MFHQRNILRVYFFIMAVSGLVLTRVIGSFIAGYGIVLLASLPIVYAIKKIFPAPDWYKNEGEKTGMTSMNLSSRNIVE